MANEAWVESEETGSDMEVLTAPKTEYVVYETPDEGEETLRGAPEAPGTFDALVQGDDPEALGIDRNTDTELGEESLAELGFKIKSKIRRYTDVIDIEGLVTSRFKRVSRELTLIGLTGIVGEWGVVNPIHVLKLEDEGMYILLDGLRRTAAALRNGNKEAEVIVWDFEDKEEGKDMANILSLMINRSQRYKNKEIWASMKILEEVNNASPGLIEYLLQLDAGDAMKMKDVMMADSDYEEIKVKFLEDQMTIDAAYKKLCNERKKENRLLKEDNLVIEPTEAGQGSFDDVPEDQKLGQSEVASLLDMAESEIGVEEKLEDMDRTSEVRGDIVQTVGDRKRIDKEIKNATMIRDNFKCRCCGVGGAAWLGVLVYHHVVPVFLAGPDTVENGLTICANCHLNLHLYAFGKVPVNIEELDERNQEIFRNIFKYGNVIIEGMKRAGMNKDAAFKKDADSRRHLMPGEGLKENTEAFTSAGNEAPKVGGQYVPKAKADESSEEVADVS